MTSDIPSNASDTSIKLGRRSALKCMAWAGAGAVFALRGGVPQLLGSRAEAAAISDFVFAQISDSHIGFNKEPNTDPAATLQEALNQVTQGPRPRLLLHTGDVSHLSKPEEFERADQVIRGAGLETYFVPGEHDVIGDDGAGFRQRFGRGAGSGWYSFDQGGAHFVGLANVLNLRPGGLGYLGSEQLEWLERDLKDRGASTPIVVFAHMPLWSLYPQWGWGTDDSEQALAYLRRFGSVTVLNGHIHQIMQKVEGHIVFHTARSTAFPQPAAGQGAGPGPLKVPAEQLRSMLGVSRVEVLPGGVAPAIEDATLNAGVAHRDTTFDSMFMGD